MEMQIIKTKATKELQEHEEQLRAQLFALRIQKAIGKLDTPHMINQLRKDIARIKTELSFRSLNGEKIKPLNIIKMTLPEEQATTKKEKVVNPITKKIKSDNEDKKQQKTEDIEKVANPSTKKIKSDNKDKKQEKPEDIAKKSKALASKSTLKKEKTQKASVLKKSTKPKTKENNK